MKKRWLVLLALVLVMTGVLHGFALAEETPPAQVGDVVHGFEVMEVGKFPLINADLVLFEHKKTGAKLLYLANDDINRVFELTFITPVPDDTGIPHVFEHSTLDGSKKYPSKALFFNLSYQTYNTFMNAATYDVMTTYPVASLSEQQLLMYADYYTDSCFNPMLYEDESIFLEEAWRYALNKPESKLTITGTVYSEMMGSYTLDSAALLNFTKTLFPGSSIGNSFGGIPEKIPDMTRQDLLDYHQAYYHPSNSLACLYGSFDNYAAFLELLDGYYSQYDRAEIHWDDPNYVPLTESVVKTFEYGVERNSEATGTVYYGIILEGADEADIEALDMTSYLLASEALPLVNNLWNELPAATLDCYVDITVPEPTLVFAATGVNEGDEAIVKRIVDDSLRQIVEEGFDPAIVDAIAASVRIDAQLMTESASVGVDIIPNIAYYWAATGDLYGYMKYTESLSNFETLAASGAFTEALEKYVLNNSNQRSALVLTKPVPGLKEEKAAAQAERLADIKAAMSEEEIAAIVERTQALANASDSEEYVPVSQLQAVSVEELPEEVRVYDVTDEVGADTVRRLDMSANVDGLGQALVMLDASLMEQEDLHWFKLYTDLIGSLSTSEHSREELASLTMRYLYNGEIRPSILQENGAEDCSLRMRASWIGFDEDMADAYNLIYEILFETQFTDEDAVRDAVIMIYSDLYNSLNAEPYQFQLYRAMGSANPGSALYGYMTQIDYYSFLNDVLDQLDEDPDAVLKHLVRVQNLLNNRTDAISGFAGSEESIAAHRAAADAFLQRLDTKTIVKHVYDLPQCAQREALVVNSSVQYNMIFASYEQLGLDGYAGELDAVAGLVSDAFLYPMLRDQYGAYGVMHYAVEDGIYLLSYRDPNITETFEVYEMLPEVMEELAAEIDQETLDGYIMSSYAYYAQSEGELSGALYAMFSVIEHRPQDEVLETMRALKSITVESLSSYVEVYQNLLDNGLRSTSGGASAINAHEDLYDQILPIS